MGTIAPLNPHN